MRGVGVAVLVAVAAASGSPVSAQELLELAGAFGASRPGPLERRAHLVTPDNPIPPRVFHVTPWYPPEAEAVGARVVVTLRVTVDDVGQVAELRLADVPMLGAWQRGAQAEPEPMPSVFRALVAAAGEAVRQWRYEPPTEAPLAFDVAVSYSPDDEPCIAERGFAPLPPAPPTQAAGGGLEPEPPAPWAEGVVRAADLIVQPTKVKHVSPKYPAEALQNGIEGVVVVEARIEPDGRIFNVRVVRSIPVFDQAALDSVLQWEFTPTLRNGVAVPVLLTATFKFTGQ
jgi:TonB family protein